MGTSKEDKPLGEWRKKNRRGNRKKIKNAKNDNCPPGPQPLMKRNASHRIHFNCSWTRNDSLPQACRKIQLKGPSVRQQLKRKDCGEAHIFIKKKPCSTSSSAPGSSPIYLLAAALTSKLQFSPIRLVPATAFICKFAVHAE